MVELSAGENWLQCGICRLEYCPAHPASTMRSTMPLVQSMRKDREEQVERTGKGLTSTSDVEFTIQRVTSLCQSEK